MGMSVFLAQIFGPCFLIVAVGIMFNRKFYQKVMEDFCKNAAMVYLGGVLALVIGLLVVLSHNLWVARWPVIITIYGWGGLIKGSWLIAFPHSVARFVRAYQRHPALLVGHSVIVLAFGAALTFFGYFGGDKIIDRFFVI